MGGEKSPPFSKNYFSYVIRSKIKFDFFTNLEYNLIIKEKENRYEEFMGRNN